jgi:hypothetical protein
MVSFHAVSLFTYLPLEEEIDILDQYFSKDITSLFHLACTPTCFLFDGQYCEQKHGVAIKSLLSLVIGNCVMEHSDAWVWVTAALKPSC